MSESASRSAATSELPKVTVCNSNHHARRACASFRELLLLADRLNLGCSCMSPGRSSGLGAASSRGSAMLQRSCQERIRGSDTGAPVPWPMSLPAPLRWGTRLHRHGERCRLDQIKRTLDEIPTWHRSVSHLHIRASDHLPSSQILISR